MGYYCDLCKNTVSNVEYTHIRTQRHINSLMKEMARRKKISIKKYGYYKYNPLLYSIKENVLV